MKKTALSIVACAVAAGTGLYFWNSRAGTDAHIPAPDPSEEAPPESASTNDEAVVPDSPVQHPAPAVTVTTEHDDPGTPPSPEEQRAVAIARLAGAMQPLYEDVGQDVGLDGPETEALIRLMAEQQLRLSDANLDSSSAGAAAAYQELKNQFQREIELQIGADRARRLASYQDTLNARSEVEEARRVLEAASQPMTDSQRKAWIRGAIDRGAFVDEPDFLGGGSSVAVMQEHLARIEMSDQKLLSVARGILDPQQFHRYESYVTQRRERFDAAIRREEQEAVRR